MGTVYRVLPNLAAKPARLKDWPLFDWWRFVVDGFGNCGVREYVMGVPLPVWSLMFFGSVLLIVWGMLFKLRRR